MNLVQVVEDELSIHGSDIGTRTERWEAIFSCQLNVIFSFIEFSLRLSPCVAEKVSEKGWSS